MHVTYEYYATTGTIDIYCLVSRRQNSLYSEKHTYHIVGVNTSRKTVMTQVDMSVSVMRHLDRS